MAKTGLGRGLSALIGGASVNPPASQLEKGEQVRQISVQTIIANRHQPRTHFRDEPVQELADSIKENGILQPLVVRPSGNQFELVAGERRLRAAKLAGLQTVPVLVRTLTDEQSAVLALIENLQRVDLDPVEEAHGFARLIKEFALTQESVAKRVGKSRAAVANALRLLNLAEELQGLLASGQLSVGHAKVILGLSNADEQRLAGRRVIEQSLNVRQTEELVKSMLNPAAHSASSPSKKGAKASTGSATWKDLEQQLQRLTGTRVTFQGSGEKGQIQLHYFSADELQRLLELLGVKG